MAISLSEVFLCPLIDVFSSYYTEQVASEIYITNEFQKSDILDFLETIQNVVEILGILTAYGEGNAN